jgi:hypothetical protein
VDESTEDELKFGETSDETKGMDRERRCGAFRRERMCSEDRLSSDDW